VKQIQLCKASLSSFTSSPSAAVPARPVPSGIDRSVSWLTRLGHHLGRRLGGLSGLFLGAALLAGCAGNNPPPPPPAPKPVAPVAPAPAPAPVPVPVKPQLGAKIGLLLPLSGQYAGLGRALLQSAEMALFDTGDDSFTLMVEDAASSQGPEGAARKLLAGGANILLGPVFGADVRRVAPISTAAHVPLLAFSNDSTLAQSNVYVLGLTPQAQVQRVVTYAAAQNLKKFAILAPNSPYGRLVLTSFQDQVAKSGGTVAQISFYDPSSLDFTQVVQEVANAQKTSGFEALMIPEGAAKLRQIAPLLPAFEVGPQQVRLLGTVLWNDPSLLQEPGLAGGWYAATAPDRWQDFAKRYQQNYSANPDQLGGLVYDAVTLAVALGKGPKGADFSQAALTNPNGFSGVSGLFRLMPDGTVDRGLAILELAPGAAIQRDAAPSSFVPPTN
jgi:ABC-type branched-subunit amino acid transport system substrate-binding protein